MLRELQRLVGRKAEIIYWDRNGVMTKRAVLIHAANTQYVEVYCLMQREPRRFRTERVLAVSRHTPRTG